MSAMKDRLIQAAELLDMDPDDLMSMLNPGDTAPATNRADDLLIAARECAEEGLEGHALRRYRALDQHLSNGGDLPREWEQR
jgi:hypothetical protein